MDVNKQIRIGLGLSIVAFIISYIITRPDVYNACWSSICADSFVEIFGPTLVLFSLTSFIFLILLYFLPPSIFKAWRKFVYWFVPLSVVLIVLVPADGSGAFMPGPDREIAIWLFASLYALIGMLLIAMKWIRVHSKNKA
jgi:hypothetical protein